MGEWLERDQGLVPSPCVGCHCQWLFSSSPTSAFLSSFQQHAYIGFPLRPVPEPGTPPPYSHLGKKPDLTLPSTTWIVLSLSCQDLRCLSSDFALASCSILSLDYPSWFCG